MKKDIQHKESSLRERLRSLAGRRPYVSPQVTEYEDALELTRSIGGQPQATPKTT